MQVTLLLWHHDAAHQGSAGYWRSAHDPSWCALQRFIGGALNVACCRREDQSTCFQKDDPYYEVTIHGVNMMIERFFDEVAMLLLDVPSDVNMTSTRLDYIWQIGMNDLRYALKVRS